MSDWTYEVPQGGVDAAFNAVDALTPVDVYGALNTEQIIMAALEAFAQWQSENPKAPTDEQIMEFQRRPIGASHGDKESVRATVVEWVRQMYRKPKAEVPAEIEEMIAEYKDSKIEVLMKQELTAAYRLGYAACEGSEKERPLHTIARILEEQMEADGLTEEEKDAKTAELVDFVKMVGEAKRKKP